MPKNERNEKNFSLRRLIESIIKENQKSGKLTEGQKRRLWDEGFDIGSHFEVKEGMHEGKFFRIINEDTIVEIDGMEAYVMDIFGEKEDRDQKKVLRKLYKKTSKNRDKDKEKI